MLSPFEIWQGCVPLCHKILLPFPQFLVGLFRTYLSNTHRSLQSAQLLLPTGLGPRHCPWVSPARAGLSPAPHSQFPGPAQGHRLNFSWVIHFYTLPNTFLYTKKDISLSYFTLRHPNFQTCTNPLMQEICCVWSRVHNLTSKYFTFWSFQEVCEKFWSTNQLRSLLLLNTTDFSFWKYGKYRVWEVGMFADCEV